MAKFKVGDRVRVRDNMTRSGMPIKEYPIGATLTVDHICDDGYGNDAYLFNGHGQYLRRDQVEPSPPTIQAGKFYKTRDGRRVGPMRQWSDIAKHRWEADDDDLPYIWADDGTEIDSGIDDGADLVAEADEPVNLKEEIESGRMSVDAARAQLGHDPVPTDAAGYTVPLCAYEDAGGLFEIKNGKVTFRTQTIRVSSNQPAIVCLIENGQPKPADRPHVHRNKAAASKEAERLAKKYPGKRFGVYKYVSHAEVAKPAYKHEWQRLAAEGNLFGAANNLTKLSGIDYDTAYKTATAIYRAA